MVFINQYTKNLLDKFPKFAMSDSLKEEIELMGNPKVITAYTIFSALTNYVVNALISNNEKPSQEELDIYKFIEEIRVKFSRFTDHTDEFDIDNAACTCFLENLMNYASSGRIENSRFIPNLGKKSKEYCRAWDEFTGTISPGLWDDEK